MGVYLINFLIYSMAMVGLLFLCLMIYKKTMIDNRFAKNDNDLKIENALNLSQRKTLYVIKAGNEKFLIAADVDRTSFLAKLNQNIQEKTPQNIMPVPQTVQTARKNQKESQVIDYSEVMNAIKTTRNSQKQPVMKEMLRKLSEPIKKD
ncbi:MAG: flagellar biosynthetic protein FliO [Clostridium sp.]|nr:flagellar biosynthetic protein FliO [Clostridium sp.]